MHVKRFTACALAAVLALSPVGGLTAGAAETQEPELILYASFDDEPLKICIGSLAKTHIKIRCLRM